MEVLTEALDVASVAERLLLTEGSKRQFFQSPDGNSQLTIGSSLWLQGATEADIEYIKPHGKSDSGDYVRFREYFLFGPASVFGASNAVALSPASEYEGDRLTVMHYSNCFTEHKFWTRISGMSPIIGRLMTVIMDVGYESQTS